VNWLWIVIDGQRPIGFSNGKSGDWSALHTRPHAESFISYGDAYRARNEIRGRYYKYANAAPSADSPQFKLWMARAENVRIIRVLVSR
jgi:hypothetical protein